MKAKYFVLCGSEIFMDGTLNFCRSYIKKQLKKFPKHREMIIVKVVE